MKRLLAAASIVGFVILSQRGGTAQRRGEFNQVGNFGVSCGTFTASEGLQRQGYVAWLTGFVSGASYAYSMEGLRLAETDFGGVGGWIEKYCTEKPLDPMASAGTRLVDELRARGR
jgi:hypothetical protein